AYTSVALTFTGPDGVVTVVDNSRVTVPAVPYDDPRLGLLDASTYMQFTTIATDFPVAGDWSVVGTYEDATPKTLYGDCALFEVLSTSCYPAAEEEEEDSCGCSYKRDCRCGDCI